MPRQVDELAAAHRQHVAEARALQEGRALLGDLAAAAPDLAASERAGAAALAGEAAQELVHSACRHLYFQRAEAQLLLRKLLFCAAELHSARARSCRLWWHLLHASNPAMLRNVRWVVSTCTSLFAEPSVPVQDADLCHADRVHCYAWACSIRVCGRQA